MNGEAQIECASFGWMFVFMYHIIAIMPVCRKRYCNLQRCKVEHIRDTVGTWHFDSTTTMGTFIFAVTTTDASEYHPSNGPFLVNSSFFEINENVEKFRPRENIICYVFVYIVRSCSRSCPMFMLSVLSTISILIQKFTESSDVMLSCHRFWFIELIFFTYFLSMFSSWIFIVSIAWLIWL